MDDDDAQFLVVELAAGVNCQDLSETLGTQPFEHANYQWLVLGSTPAGNAVVAAVAGAEVAPEPTKAPRGLAPGPAGRGRRGRTASRPTG